MRLIPRAVALWLMLGASALASNYPVPTINGGTGTNVAPTDAQIPIGQSDGSSLWTSLSGCTLNDAGLLTCSGSAASFTPGVTTILGATPPCFIVNSTSTTSACDLLGANVPTALGVAVGTPGAFVVLGGAGGTPSSLTLTNATGLPIAGLSGLGTNVGTALGIALGSSGAFVTNNAVNTFTASQRTSTQTPTISTSTFTPAIASGNDVRINLTSACPCTLANFSGSLVAGQKGIIEIAQDGTGSRTIGTWGSQYATPGGTASITLSTAASSVDYLPYAVDSSATVVVLGSLIKGPTH